MKTKVWNVLLALMLLFVFTLPDSVEAAKLMPNEEVTFPQLVTFLKGTVGAGSEAVVPRTYYVAGAATAAYKIAKPLLPPYSDGAQRLYTTIDNAINACTASRGDVIYVLPGHTETISAATTCVMDTAGVQVIGVGEGSMRPTLTFSTATTAIINISGAGCSLQNLVLVGAIDQLAAFVDLQADDITIKDCEIRTNGSTSPVKVIKADGAGTADRAKIIGNFIQGPSASGYTTHGIWSDDVQDGWLIQGNIITGAFTTAGIWSDAAMTNLVITPDNIIKNVAGPSTLLSAAVTGGPWFSEPTDPVSGRWRSFTVTADMTSATWNTAAAHEIITVTGTCRIRLLCVAGGTLTDAADGATIALGNETSTAGLIAATNAAGKSAATISAGEIWCSATDANNITLGQYNFGDTAVGIAVNGTVLDFIDTGGKDVGYTIGSEALTGGSLIFYVWWEPISSDGLCVAGAGGAL